MCKNEKREQKRRRNLEKKPNKKQKIDLLLLIGFVYKYCMAWNMKAANNPQATKVQPIEL